MTNMEQVKRRLWDVPQFFREQKDVLTEKRERYNGGIIRDRFTFSEEVGMFEEWRVNGKVGERPAVKSQPQMRSRRRNNILVRGGINAKAGKTVLWVLAVVMLVVVLSDVMGLAVTGAELKQINAKIVKIRQERDTIEGELSQKLGTRYISQATQLNNVSASSNTLMLHVPDEATLPMDIAESEISRESLAVIYGD